jgi:hypothetical protein
MFENNKKSKTTEYLNIYLLPITKFHCSLDDSAIIHVEELRTPFFLEHVTQETNTKLYLHTKQTEVIQNQHTPLRHVNLRGYKHRTRRVQCTHKTALGFPS